VSIIGYVYRFLDKEGVVLYVGFTTQELKHRLYQHFNHGHLKDFVYNSTYKIQYFEDDNKTNGRIYELAAINEFGSLFNKDGNYMQKSTIIGDILNQKQWVDLEFDIEKYIEKVPETKPKEEKLMQMLDESDYYINNTTTLCNDLNKFDYKKMQDCLYYIADNLQSILNMELKLVEY
jgi:excinuclease UvrABC nuclease subunit